MSLAGRVSSQVGKEQEGTLGLEIGISWTWEKRGWVGNFWKVHGRFFLDGIFGRKTRFNAENIFIYKAALNA